jgi:phenylpropionate dioxygenase-like ring-hydroxylating dioxygenase large terminal subunit
MFLAHVNDLKEGEYKPLLQFNNKKVIVKDQDYRLISNVCPHQKSLISTCQGRGARVCPYHGWSFDIKGNPLGSGLAAFKNENSLDSDPVYEWNGFLFSSPVSVLEAEFINGADLVLQETRIDHVKATANNIMDLFLDVDHIELVHAGVYDKINMPDIRKVDWHYYNWGSLQLVPNDTGYGAAWLAVYPNTMIEWQKGAVFITVANDLGNGTSDVIVYKYRDENSNNTEWDLNSDIWETAWFQDKQQAELIAEFNNDYLEESKQHFRMFLQSSS